MTVHTRSDRAVVVDLSVDENDDGALRVRQRSGATNSSRSEYYEGKQNHDIICIDEDSEDDADSSTSTNERRGPKEANSLANRDIIYIDGVSDGNDDNGFSNSTTEQAGSENSKAPTNHDIICIDGVSDASDDDDDGDGDDSVSSNSMKEQFTSKMAAAMNPKSMISTTTRTSRSQHHRHGSEPPSRQRRQRLATLAAFKRPDAKAGIVFARRSPLRPSVVVVSGVRPGSISSRHRLPDDEGGEGGPGPGGAEVAAVDGVPARDPRHAAELVTGADGEVRLTVRRGGTVSERGNDDGGGAGGGESDDDDGGDNLATRTTAANTAAKTTNTKVTRNNEGEGSIWKRLQRILDNKACKDEPAGPSEEENRLLSHVTEFGITPYKYEVPLGNGVSDCVGHDMNNRLCVVEAKCLSTKKGLHCRREKVVEQTTSYATFLAQETRSDVAAYSFDDQNGLIALQSFGVFEYEKVKHRDPRGRDAAATKLAKNRKRVHRKNHKSAKRNMHSRTGAKYRDGHGSQSTGRLSFHPPPNGRRE